MCATTASTWFVAIAWVPVRAVQNPIAGPATRKGVRSVGHNPIRTGIFPLTPDKTATFITGRSRTFEVTSLDFEEYLVFRSVHLGQSDRPQALPGNRRQNTLPGQVVAAQSNSVRHRDKWLCRVLVSLGMDSRL